MISGNDAATEVGKEFPELKDDLEKYRGMLHTQMGIWSYLAQRFIDIQDSENFQRICMVFLELFSDASPELENALNVSFLENLSFENGERNRKWAYNAMPERMRIAWDEMEEYNSKIHGSN